MKTKERIAAAVLAFAAGATAPVDAQARQLAHVGTLTSVDTAKRAFVLEGPDGKSVELTLDEGAIITPVKKPEKIPLEKLADHVGKPASVFLTSATMAGSLFLADAVSEEEVMTVMFVPREASAVQFRSSDDMVVRYKPAVNMLAAEGDGKPVGEASWDWFEAHRGQRLRVRTIPLPGMTCMWSAEVVAKASPTADDAPAPGN